jgi:hypothetical protein
VLTDRRRWIACAAVFLGSLAVLVPSLADFGLTYDEPAYRYSQETSIQWWEQLARVRSAADLGRVLDPDALLYHWPYARHGINFHPPLAGQLNLLTHALTGSFLKDIPSRRLASSVAFAATVAMIFGFVARRSGVWPALAAAGSLLTMPRLFGQAHLIDTDTTGMMIWVALALAAWRGLTVPGARGARMAVGILAGLAFVEKMATIYALFPLLAWLLVGHLMPAIYRARRADWIDGLLTLGALAAPLVLTYLEIRRLTVPAPGRVTLPPTQYTDLFAVKVSSALPGAILMVPLGFWIARRLLARWRPASPIWWAERPALEILAAMMAFGPAVGWLGNPAWWRETLPRLAHYYMLNTARRGSLPDIQILYFGQTYEYSLPWHNAWVLLAITVPVSVLAASLIGLAVGFGRIRRGDVLPLYLLVNLATGPVMRMLPTPAHDGVRLFLPTFAFLAIFAGWGAGAVGAWLARRRPRWGSLIHAAVVAAVVAPSSYALARIHPYELSYFNSLIGGPRGAWKAGFELSYWYDALTPGVLRDLNERLPEGATLAFANEMSAPVMVLSDLQSLGDLRGDIVIGVRPGAFPHMMLLTHDSKADAFTRLLFLMRPWYASRPEQLDNLRVLTVADPVQVSRAWALQILADRDDPTPYPPLAPEWVRANAPWLARFWGDGVTRFRRLGVNDEAFAWAKDDPDSLLRAARRIANGRTSDGDDDAAARLRAILDRYPDRSSLLLKARPEALVEAVEILIARPDAVRAALMRYPYTDPNDVGGPIDDRFHSESTHL